MDLYVYYHVPLANASALLLRAQAMQQSLSEQFNVQARLKRRPELSNDCQTWMEVYPEVSVDFPAALEQAVATHALPELISGERHNEFFVDIDTCV